MTIDPIFEFADEVTAHLPRRTQRLYALAYIRALQTNPGRFDLKTALPPRLYRGVRHFMAETEWDHRELIWRAAARVLPQIGELEWFGCRVTTVARKWTFAWLAGYSADAV